MCLAVDTLGISRCWTCSVCRDLMELKMLSHTLSVSVQRTVRLICLNTKYCYKRFSLLSRGLVGSHLIISSEICCTSLRGSRRVTSHHATLGLPPSSREWHEQYGPSFYARVVIILPQQHGHRIRERCYDNFFFFFNLSYDTYSSFLCFEAGRAVKTI